MTMANLSDAPIMNIISWACGILGLSGGGILFYKSNKIQAEAKGRIDDAKADLAEADAYRGRIKSLAEEMTIMTKKAEEARAKIDELENQLTSAMTLIKNQELTISQLTQQNEYYKELTAELEKKNSSLKMQIAKTRKYNKDNAED